jgi:hypothetical protein
MYKLCILYILRSEREEKNSAENVNNYNNINQLQLGCHPVAVVIYLYTNMKLVCY